MCQQIFSVIAITYLSYYDVYVSGYNECVPRLSSSSGSQMLYVDTRARDLQCPIDTFFDRLVPIYHVKEKILVTTGVYVKKNRILTSFNPFRLLSKTNKSMLMDHLKPKNMVRRIINKTDIGDVIVSYDERVQNFDCGRQVVPDFDILPDSDMRHGIHSPLHDLMVFRITVPVAFIDPVPPRLFTFYDQVQVSNLGPIRTVLAKPGDEFGEEIMFASAGHRTRYDMKQHIYLFREIYNRDDKVVADCEEWFPRQWGHFICLLNKKPFAGIASGAMLFSDEKLFGVGSFALFKGKRGVLVFTDVRPYWHLIYQTCTTEDIAKNMPLPPPTTQYPFYTDVSDYTE